MLPVSPLMDRKKAGITKSQPGVSNKALAGESERIAEQATIQILKSGAFDLISVK